jgi:hypothetical protein
MGSLTTTATHYCLKQRLQILHQCHASFHNAQASTTHKLPQSLQAQNLPSRVGLNIDGPFLRIQVESLQGALLAEQFCPVDIFVSTIIPSSGLPFRVLIGHTGPQSSHYRCRSEVLRSNKLNSLPATTPQQQVKGTDQASYKTFNVKHLLGYILNHPCTHMKTGGPGGCN